MITVMFHKGQVEWDIDLVLNSVLKGRHKATRVNALLGNGQVARIKALAHRYSQCSSPAEALISVRHEIAKCVESLHSKYDSLLENRMATAKECWLTYGAAIERRLRCFFGLKFHPIRTTAFMIVFPVCPCFPLRRQFALSAFRPAESQVRTLMHELIHICHYSSLQAEGISLGEKEMLYPSPHWFVSELLVERWCCIHGPEIGAGLTTNSYFDEDTVRSAVALYGNGEGKWTVVDLHLALMKFVRDVNHSRMCIREGLVRRAPEDACAPTPGSYA